MAFFIILLSGYHKQSCCGYTVPSESIHTPWLIPHCVTAWIQNGLHLFISHPIYTQYPIVRKKMFCIENEIQKYQINISIYTTESIHARINFGSDYSWVFLGKSLSKSLAHLGCTIFAQVLFKKFFKHCHVGWSFVDHHYQFLPHFESDLCQNCN
jgi:hypothetical protein